MKSLDTAFPRGSKETVEIREKGPFVNMLGFRTLKESWNILGRIRDIGDRDMTVSLPNHLVGYLAASEISDADAPGWKTWFRKNDLIVVRIIRLDRESKRIELSCKPRIVNGEMSVDSLFVGLCLAMEVRSEEDVGYVLGCSDHMDRVFFLAKEGVKQQLDVGQVVTVTVSEIQRAVVRVRLGGPGSQQEGARYESLMPGSQVRCRVSRVSDGQGLAVTLLGGRCVGTVDLFNIPVVCGSDGVPLSLPRIYKVGDELMARILYVDQAAEGVGLTALDLESGVGRCRYRVGDVVTGAQVVQSMGKYGVMLDLGDRVFGLLRCSQMGEAAPVGCGDRVEKARIVDVDHFSHWIYLSAQRAVLEQKVFGYQGIRAGEVVRGQVKKIESYGAVVELGPGVRAICPAFHWTERNKLDAGHEGETAGLRDVKAPACPFVVGKHGRFRVLMVDPEARRVMLTFKHSLVNSDLPILTDIRKAEEYGQGFHGFVVQTGPAGAVVGFCSNLRGYLPAIHMRSRPSVGQVLHVRCVELNRETDKMWLAMVEDEPRQEREIEIPGPLGLLNRIREDPGVASLSAPREEVAGAVEGLKRARVPESGLAVDHERELVASPDSSYAWIQYMAYLISTGDKPGARSVARRALDRIQAQLEDERFNVWNAWIRFEWNNLLESADSNAIERFESVLDEAASRADRKRILLAAWGLMTEEEPTGSAAQQVQRLQKRIRHQLGASCKAWILVWSHHRSDEASKLMGEAMEALPLRKHVKFIQKLALIEYQRDRAEHGRNLFERLVGEHPRRLDLWFVYIQSEIKHVPAQPKINESHLEVVRRLFERVLATRLSVSKAKSVFKLYFRFETQFGSEQSVERVTAAARDYVQKSNASSINSS